MKRYADIIPAALLLAVSLAACRPAPTPKPDAYFRIDPPAENYRRAETLPVTFEISAEATATPASPAEKQPEVLWSQIHYPRYHATLYCSYHPLRGNLASLLEENRELIYRQSVYADAVQASRFEDEERPLYATLYELSGESATPIQFIATDSLRYLLRGALYFDTPVQNDSITPVLGYLTDEVIHLIETIEYPH